MRARSITIVFGVGVAIAGIGLAMRGSPRVTARHETPTVDIYGDPLPAGAFARLGTTRFRHPYSVVSVAFSPDGKTLVTSCEDGLIRTFDVVTGRKLASVQGPGPYDGSLLSPDGKKAVTSKGNLWDVATGKELATLEPRGGFAL